MWEQCCVIQPMGKSDTEVSDLLKFILCDAKEGWEHIFFFTGKIEC